MPDLYITPHRRLEKKGKTEKEAQKTFVAPKTEIKRENKSIIRCRKLVKDLSTKTGLAVAPQDVRFANQKKDEEVLFLLRRHLITNFPWVAAFVLMIGIVFSAFHFGFYVFLPSTLRLVVVYAWLLLALIIFWSGFLSWYFNVNIISNERVVDVDFYNLIYKEISDAEIENIEDVTLVMAGVAQTVFNYGSVLIQTAAETPQLRFENVPNPALVVQVLKKMQMEEKQETLEGRVR